MIKCPNCGAIQKDGAKFCIKCGNNMDGAQQVTDENAFSQVQGSETEGQTAAGGQQGSQQPGAYPSQFQPQGNGTGMPQMNVPKKHFPWLAVIIPAAVVVVCLAAFLLVRAFNPMLFASNQEKFLYYQGKAATDKFTGPFWDAFPDTNTLDTDVTVTAKTSDAAAQEYLKDASLLLKIKSEEDQSVVNADLNIMGSSVLTATLTADGTTYGLYMPEILDDYYVADVPALYEKLSGEDVPDFDGLKDAPSKDVLLRYGEIFKGVIRNDNIKKEKMDVDFKGIDGEVKNATVLTFAPTK